MFLLDSTPTMTNEEYQVALNALVQLTNNIVEQETGNNSVNIALVTFGREVQLHRRLDETTSKTLLLGQIQRLVLSSEDYFQKNEACNISSFDQAIQFLKNNVFIMNTKRDDLRNVLIIISNGKLSINKTITDKLQHFTQEQISSYGIAVGPLANLNNMNQLVEDPAMVYTIVDQMMMMPLDALMAEIFFSSCSLSNDFEKN